MQITKETIDRLPLLEFTKFDGNKVICWDNNFFVATLEIEETIPSCIVDKKTISMLKLLSNKKIDIEVKETFNIKADKSRYKGLLIDNGQDIGFIEKNDFKPILVGNKTISKALKFIGNKQPFTKGINLSENGVIATDGLKLYANGTYGKGVVLDAEFLKKIKFDYNQIEFNDTGVKIVDTLNQVSYYGSVLAVQYPNVDKLINIGLGYQKLDLDLNDIQEDINLALESVKSKGDKEAFEVINLKTIDNKLNIITDNFQASTNINIDVDISFTSNFVNEFSKLKDYEIYYSDSLKPMYFKNETETYLFLPLKRND